MERNTFHTDPGASAFKPRFMVLMLGVDNLEASPAEQQVTKTVACTAGRSACAIDPGLQREVATFVAALPYQQRTALMLRLRHKLGYAEIAGTLGCSEREARSTVYELLHSLRAHLGDRL
jgi:DNA-directed RNA polymerase specialized sigma24 family protein